MRFLFHPVTFFVLAVISGVAAYQFAEQVHHAGGAMSRGGADFFAAYDGHAIDVGADGGATGFGCLSGFLFLTSALLYVSEQHRRSTRPA